MAIIYPFRALRPPVEQIEQVASVPYDVVSTEEARALAANNPLSLLHVTRPEIDLRHQTYDELTGWAQTRRLRGHGATRT